MTKPTECKWCGCRDTTTNRSDSVTFACGTYWDDHHGGVWVQHHDTCGGLVGDLYRRIRRALEALMTAKRHEFVVNFLSSMQQRDDGDFVEFDDVEKVIQILEGESDEAE